MPGLSDVSNHAMDLYQAIGGAAACRRLSVAFYARVARDPLLRPLFASTFRCAIEQFAAFLAQILGGPPEDAQRRWWVSLRESHARFHIGIPERDAWMRNMAAALADAGIEDPARSALRGFFERGSAHVVNQGDAPPAVLEERSSEPVHQEMASRWAMQRALDEAVAAIRRGDSAAAIALAQADPLSTWFHRDRAVHASLLAVMIGSGDSTLADHVRHTLPRDPALARARYSGRTLLHAAAASGNVTLLELLLSLGASAMAADDGGHTALYSVGNECSTAGGADVVRTLVEAGADVNAAGGVKRCTALHMAARRGNAEVARALLDAGANIEARDSLGETPLRRAVNCAKTGVARLLVARGADRDSKSTKGLTPRMAARTKTMRLALGDESA